MQTATTAATVFLLFGWLTNQAAGQVPEATRPSRDVVPLPSVQQPAPPPMWPPAQLPHPSTYDKRWHHPLPAEYLSDSRARYKKPAGNERLDVPFLSLPEVLPVPVSEDKFALGFLDYAQRPDAVARYSFDKPAQFPMPGFASGGEPAPTAGAIIYEGMRLIVREGGEFDVIMTVGIPDRPVTLRLQLKFCVTARGSDDLPREFTITLPPIELNPVLRTVDLDLGPPPLRDAARLTFHVNHEGFSPVLQDFQDDFGGNVTVTRDGVARFGTTPPRLFAR